MLIEMLTAWRVQLQLLDPPKVFTVIETSADFMRIRVMYFQEMDD